MTIVAHPISIHRYLGLSTDTKPTIANPLGLTPPTIGSTLYETDSGILYTTIDGTNWVPKDVGSRRSWLFGSPNLRAANAGSTKWTQDTTQGQKGASGWQAKLTGGAQSGNDDWAACFIPVNELSVIDFNSAQWTYWLTNAEEHGFNIVIWIHDPTDNDKRVEVTQAPSHVDLARAQYWNAHKLDTSVTQFFYYGEPDPVVGTGLTKGTQYTWAEYQADVIFKTWTIYRISIEYGWYSTGTFEAGWLVDLKLNGEVIILKPELVDIPLSSTLTPKVVTGSGEVYGFPCKLYWVSWYTSAQSPGEGDLRDGGSGSTQRFRWGVMGVQNANYDHRHVNFNPSIHFTTNLYATLASSVKMTLGYIPD